MSADDADRPETPAVTPPTGLPDLGGLLESAQQMMHNAEAAASERVVGSASGGLVSVELDGRFEFHDVSIDPSVVDADDVSLLEDLVLAALRDAAGKIRERQEGALGGLDLGGLDLGGLGNLFGGGE